MPEKLTRVEFTNLDKILFPEHKITKAQVIEHYVRSAPKMLNLLKNRPAVLNRFPDGIEKEGFYEKDAPLGTPSWVKTFRRFSETAEREIKYVLCNDLDTLVWCANLAALEIHLTLSRADSFEVPDLVLFDIDPEPPLIFDDVVDVALLVKEELDALNLKSYVKTSGKKGLHVVVPVVPEYTFKQTREFVHQIGRRLSKESEIVVSEFSRSRDAGTVFIDFLQNAHGRTMMAPYSLRPTRLATVSTPLEWGDVKKGLKPESFNIFTVARLEKSPWKDLLENKQKLVVD
jgi:bifunctional non-homologous end joining protein LigD